ncbi:MAG: 1-acyl-sn-glycerol-3-phosphate acyltransferase [Spirochaetaceae bacterium]|jgi:1-acyl-sn-glycerol-3-phosphate acyltransferase|nr:1-acyl-sn-glycerol-3-phosphate acyltransferase [Spirochaetaceae bacterium]
MPYKRGRPLLDVSLPFRLAAALVFYPLWPLAHLINLLLYATGYEHTGKLRGIRRAVLVSNHTTFLDPVKVSGAVLPGRTWQTLLEGTVATPFLGTFVRLLGGMPLPPGKSGLDRILASAETAFRYRRFIHFYPEGECYLYNQKINDFKPGAFYIAAELDIPVIPLVTVFSEGPFKPFSFWGRSLPREKMIVLDPVYPSRFIRRNEKGMVSMDSVREFAQVVREIMQQEIDARQGSSAFYRGQMKRMKGIND